MCPQRSACVLPPGNDRECPALYSTFVAVFPQLDQSTEQVLAAHFVWMEEVFSSLVWTKADQLLENVLSNVYGEAMCPTRVGDVFYKRLVTCTPTLRLELSAKCCMTKTGLIRLLQESFQWYTSLVWYQSCCGRETAIKNLGPSALVIFLCT